ncbi:MAG TPA: DUF1998 domain-containing protein [Candidatus Xenobia bacterium]
MTQGTVNRPPDGQLRLSQVLMSFGPGSMLDLPETSVLIGGLDSWKPRGRRLYEERLEQRLCEMLDISALTLHEPPIDLGETYGPQTGIDAFLFPLWFLGMIDMDWQGYRSRPLIPFDRLVKGNYLGEDRKSYHVVPVRFVQACLKGHISDVDWYAFVRQDNGADRTGPLWLDEGGGGNDFSDIYVRCGKTQKRRPLSEAMVPNAFVLGRCQGRKPWLGPRVYDKCEQPNRLLTRSASNAYFSQVMSAISIPDTQVKLREAVDQVWEDFLLYAEDLRDVTKERRREKVRYAIEGFTDEEVWAEINRRKNPTPPPTRKIKEAEIESLLAAPQGDSPMDPGGDFYARARTNVSFPNVNRIVLVHRLREVLVQIGFTRFEATLPDIDGELDLQVELAPLSRELTWLPAAENRGEGVFLSFERQAVDKWLVRPDVQAHGTKIKAGFDLWKSQRSQSKMEFPGLPYLMLHSLSHLLITAVALECGYSASAIRERVYAGDSGYGILLYTGSSGSEGTLGGLVEIGRSLERHLRRALDMGRLCSNDPVCSQHDPSRKEEERFLLGPRAMAASSSPRPAANAATSCSIGRWWSQP